MGIHEREPSEPFDGDTADLGSGLEKSRDLVVAEDIEDSPRQAPLLATDYGTTGAEERRDEPLTQRLHREEPDVRPGHRPVDPDRAASRAFAGRLVAEEGAAHVAEGDTGGFAPEEMAMHLMPEPRRSGTSRGHGTSDRIEALEAEVAVLARTARILVEAVETLALAQAGLPTEEPGDRAAKVRRAARDAHDLLLALREEP